MLLDFAATIKNVRGEPMLRQDRLALITNLLSAADGDTPVKVVLARINAMTGDAKPLSLGSVACDALCANVPGEELSAKDKVLRFELARIVVKEVPYDVKESDVETLKKAIAKAWGVEVVGSVFEIIAGAANPNAMPAA